MDHMVSRNVFHLADILTFSSRRMQIEKRGGRENAEEM